jgi:hypothetical protein
MTSWVVDLFSPVPNKGLTPRVSFPSDPFGPELQGVSSSPSHCFSFLVLPSRYQADLTPLALIQSTVFMKTVQDIRMLDIKWVIPDTDPTWQTKVRLFFPSFIRP